MKKCNLCKEVKSKDEFYKLYGKPRSVCKVCTEIKKRDYYSRNKEKMYLSRKKYREENHEKIKAYREKHIERDNARARKNYPKYYADNAEMLKEKSRRSRINNPEKAQAHDAVSNAIKSGKLVRQNCENGCNKEGQAHHEDYTKPLEVIWLCPSCHGKLHAEKRKNDG